MSGRRRRAAHTLPPRGAAGRPSAYWRSWSWLRSPGCSASTSTASAQANGWDLTLRYPRVARAGLDVTSQATATRPGGLGKNVTLAITGDYFNMFETQGFHPQPADETRDATTLYLTFAAPPGDTFVVDFDTYVQPASQPASQADSAGTLAVVDNTTLAPLTSVHFSTRLTP